MISLNVISRDFAVTESIQSELEKYALKLNRICDRITSCEVVLSLPHKHSQKGKIFHITLRLHVPGETLVVDREPGLNSAHEDFHVAVRDAFGTMKRRLGEYVERQKGFVKSHSTPGLKANTSVEEKEEEEVF